MSDVFPWDLDVIRARVEVATSEELVDALDILTNGSRAGMAAARVGALDPLHLLHVAELHEVVLDELTTRHPQAWDAWGKSLAAAERLPDYFRAAI